MANITGCPRFSFGQALADRMNAGQKDMSNYIALYNSWAEFNGKEIINPAEYEAANEIEKSKLLDVYARKLNHYIYNTLRQEKINAAETFEDLRSAVGSNAAYAESIVTKIFSAEEQVSFKNELIFLLRTLVDKSNKDNHKNESVEDYLKNHTIGELYNSIHKQYVDSAQSIYNIITFLEKKKGVKSIDENTADPQQAAYLRTYKDLKSRFDNIQKIIGEAEILPGNRIAFRNGFLSELFIANMSEFKKIFGKGFNPDSKTLFDTDETSDIHTDEEIAFDIEEEVRERWQTVLDSVDPTGSLSHIINNIISQTPQMSVVVSRKVENGKITYSKSYKIKKFTKSLFISGINYGGPGDAGKIPVFCEARTEARKLMTLLSSSTSIRDMMGKLAANKKYEALYEKLNNDVTLQTTFFQAFNKYNLKYFYTDKNGNNLKEIPLNNAGSNPVGSFLWKLKQKDYEHSIDSIFHSNIKGKEDNGVGVSGANLKLLYNYFNEMVGFNHNYDNFYKKTIKNASGEDVVVGRSLNEKIVIIENLLSKLDIPIEVDTAQTILSDNIILNKFLNGVENLIVTFANKVGSSDFKSLGFLENALKKLNGEEFSFGYASMKSILDSVNQSNEYGKSISGMITYKSSDGNKTLTSNIMMSHLTRLAKMFNNLPAQNLRDMIAKTYSSDEAFYDSKNGKYRIKWLEDMYNAADQTSGKSFRSIFGVSRTMGLNETSFENISDKGHMLSILSMYFNSLNDAKNSVVVDGRSIREGKNFASDLRDAIYDQTGEKPQSNKRYYIKGGIDSYTFNSNFTSVYKASRSGKCTLPTFLTADTIALRGVTSLHYNIDEIVDGMYDMFQFDISTSKKGMMLDSMGLPTSGNGKESTITSHPENFGCLNFFNKDFIGWIKDDDGQWVETEPGYWNKRLNDIGGLIAPEESVKNLIKEYFRTRAERFLEKDINELGIADELSIMDKGYYGDRQENALDFIMNYYFSLYNQMAMTSASPMFYQDAEDANKRNKGVLTNGMMLCADAVDPVTNKPLFDNPENPTQNVIYVYDVKPFLNERDRKTLYKAFGNTEEGKAYVDKEYKRNTLTDGEGWRSFSSWRKMGLAFGNSVWTSEMENAYNEIRRISKDIYKIEDEIERLTKESKQNFTLNEGSLEENQTRYAGSTDNQKKIDSLNKMLNGYIQQIENLAVVFQPRKPMCDGLETYRDMVIPFQHKYAEIPIIPCLFPKGSAMRQLGEFLEDHNIDMMCSDKCGKKGVFGELDVQFKTNEYGQYIDADGDVIKGYDRLGNEVSNPTRGEQRRNKEFYSKVVENRDESMLDVLNKQFRISPENPKATNSMDNRVMTPVIHACSVANYLIMNNVPDHVSANALFGNQIRKIIISGINRDKVYSYKFGGKMQLMKGSDLVTLYNALISANYFSSFSNFKKLLNDPSRLLKELSNNILANDRCDVSTIDKVVNGMPYWDASLQHDIFSTLISMFRNSVVKQRINGGNIVQASALGSDLSMRYLNDDLGFMTDANGNPTSCECVMPFNFSYRDNFGNEVALKYDDYCNADGTFKTDSEGNTLIEKEFPGMLDIVAYRIPTEAEYSCFALHVKRCCPRSGRNYIQLPTITTTRAGFDFDIDKLYLMRKTFSADQSDYALKRVWDNIFSQNNELYEAMIQARDRASKDDIDAILKKYSDAGVEEPKLEDIPLNRFWDVAVKLGLTTEDKKKIFDGYVKEHPEFIVHSKFNPLNIFNEDGSINYNKIFNSTRTSQDKINNIILDIMLQRLTDPELAQASFTAGGFAGPSADARFINAIKSLNSSTAKISESGGVRQIDVNELYDSKKVDEVIKAKSKYDFADPMTAIRFNQLNQVAAKLIGIYANDSSNYNIFANIDKMRISGVKPIIFGSLINADFADKGANLLVKEVNGKTTKQKIAELLAASVDAIKDPVLNYLNLDSVTGEAATVLIRLGYDTKDVGLLFNQPIISECLTYMKRNNVSSVSQAMNHILDLHGMPRIKDIKKNVGTDTRYLTREALAYNIADVDMDSTYYKASQQQVVKIFMDLIAIKDEFSSIVQQTRNTSSNVVKSTVGDYMARKARIDKYVSGAKLIEVVVGGQSGVGIYNVDKPMSTTQDKINFFNEFKDSPFAFEDIVYNIIDKAMNNIIDNNTPYNVGTFAKIFANAKTLCAYGTPSADVYNSIGKECAGIILSKLDGDFNPNSRYADDTVNPIDPSTGKRKYTNSELFLKHFDLFLDALKASPEALEYVENSFFNNPKIVARNIIEQHNEDGSISEYTKYSLRPNFSLPKEYKNEVISEWYHMLSTEGQIGSPVLKNFAKALFLHFYYNYGLDGTANFDISLTPSIMYNLVKADYNSDMSYNDFMNDMIDEDMSDNNISGVLTEANVYPTQIFLEWIKRNNDNKQYVYHVNESNKNAFVVRNNFIETSVKDSYILKHTVGNVEYVVPFISMNGQLYIYEGLDANPFSDKSCKISKGKIPRYKELAFTQDDSVDAFMTAENSHIFGQFFVIGESNSIEDSYVGNDGTETSDSNDNGFSESISRNEGNRKGLC